MLSEGFLTVLTYRTDEKPPSSALTKTPTSAARAHGRRSSGPREHIALLRTDPEPGPDQTQGPQSPPEPGLPIPGLPPAGLIRCLHDPADLRSGCSLMRQYPDLRLRQEPDEGAGSTVLFHSLSVPSYEFGGPLPRTHNTPSSPDPDPDPALPDRESRPDSMPDQGYLVMSGHPGLDAPPLGLEPMSNSLLNSLLEKQLDEVYRQYLTDSLARCNSQLGHSLLRGLLPPPGGPGGTSDSLEPSLQEVAASGGDALSGQQTQSHFSSPVLRISEEDGAQ